MTTGDVYSLGGVRFAHYDFAEYDDFVCCWERWMIVLLSMTILSVDHHDHAMMIVLCSCWAYRSCLMIRQWTTVLVNWHDHDEWNIIWAWWFCLGNCVFVNIILSSLECDKNRFKSLWYEK